jgi:hypothetical protein
MADLLSLGFVVGTRYKYTQREFGYEGNYAHLQVRRELSPDVSERVAILTRRSGKWEHTTTSLMRPNHMTGRWFYHISWPPGDAWRSRCWATH